MFDIVGKRKLWYTLSLIVIVPGVIAFIMGGLKPSIDFTGGSLIRLDYPDGRPPVTEITNTVATFDVGTPVVQPLGDSEVTIRMKEVNQEMYQSILTALREAHSPIDEQAFESIGPTVGQELRQKATVAIILVLSLIIIYISFAFRKAGSRIMKSWVYGLGALIALFYDILLVIGVFAVLGKYFNVEIDALFITALLTVLGFSVHDTIVVFDRIREQLKKSPQESFSRVVNMSVNATMIRSLNTSLTTLLVLFALYLFGGESIQYFILALIIGIGVGTYSSIFIASPLFVTWQRLRKRSG